MIKYLFVKNNASDKKPLPLNISDIKHIPLYDNQDVSQHEKLTILFEQFILAQSVCEMTHYDNQFKDYIDLLIKLFHQCKFTGENLNIGSRGEYLKNTIFKFMRGEISNYQNIRDIYENENSMLANKVRILPDNFVIPYLRTITKAPDFLYKEKYYNALLLVPHIKKLDHSSDVAVYFTPHTFTSYDSKEHVSFNTAISKGLTHLFKMNWCGKSWKQYVDIIQSYQAFDKTTIDTSFPNAMYRALFGGDTTFIKDTKHKTFFVQSLSYLHDKYGMNLSDVTSLRMVLEGFGYKNLSYLTTKNPTVGEVEALKDLSEFKFFESLRLRYGMEAAGDDNPDDPQTDTTPDDEDDPDTDPDALPEEGTDDTESTDDNFDDMGDDTGDDFGTDSDTDNDESENSESSKTDTPEVPEDPMTVTLRVVTTETADNYFEKMRLSDKIENMISNPSGNLSSEIISFLTLWVTQWLDLVSVETTKDVLSKLNLAMD